MKTTKKTYLKAAENYTGRGQEVQKSKFQRRENLTEVSLLLQQSALREYFLIRNRDRKQRLNSIRHRIIVSKRKKKSTELLVET